MDPVREAVSGPWLTDPALQRLLECLNADGERALVVGGAVRDALLGRPVADVDIATTAVPQDAVRRVTAAGFKAVPTGLAHGTITVVLDERTAEVTTLREDVETDGRHARVAFGRCWKADAARRDFTMNALYCDGAGAIYDPLGSGLADCLDRRVRFIGDADRRLAEDYLRLLRFFRFYAELGRGPPDGAGLWACIRARHGLARLSAERVSQEMRKLLRAPGAPGACRLLADTGLAQRVLGRVANAAVLGRLTDLGRDHATQIEFETALAAFGCHGPGDAEAIAERLRLSRRERSRLDTLVDHAMVRLHRRLPDPGEATEIALDAGRGLAVQILLLAAARLATSADPARLRSALDRARQGDLPCFPVTGDDLLELGAEPGPGLGALLQRARDAWRLSEYRIGREELLKAVAGWIGEARTGVRDGGGRKVR